MLTIISPNSDKGLRIPIEAERNMASVSVVAMQLD